MTRYQIIDTTLREGEQTPGAIFTISQKKRIIDALAEIGVDEVELGIVSTYNRCAAELIDYCRTRTPGLRTSLWSRCREQDIEGAALLSPDLLALSIPVSDLHLETRLKKRRAWAMEQMVRAIAWAKAAGLECGIGFEDATRADPDFLLEMSCAASEAGVMRIRLADTVGIFSPGKTEMLVRRVLSTVHCPVGLHTHNDFGMATGNGISGLEAGASFIDTTVLGLGERTGCARLEEVAAYLRVVCGYSHIETVRLKELAQYVASITNRQISPGTPVIGESIFHCETGLHQQGLQSGTATYEPFDPGLVGASRRLCFGAKTGLAGLSNHLRKLGVTEPVDSRIVRHVREKGRLTGRSLTDEELLAIFHQYHPSASFSHGLSERSQNG